MVICVLAVLKAAKAFLCVHPAIPLEAQRDIIGDAAPDLLLTDAAHAAAARDLVGDDSRVLLLEDIDLRYSADALHVPVEPSDPAAIFYTSRSTGRPKGVVKSHSTVLHRAWLCAGYDGLAPTDRQGALFRADALRAGLRPILPPWKIPGRIHAIESLPLTPTGKIDRPRLQQFLQARDGSVENNQAVQSHDETMTVPTAKRIRSWKRLFTRTGNR
jgi:acyl-coenzyme A synthetase/AMP-(fatty) acid ligase